MCAPVVTGHENVAVRHTRTALLSNAARTASMPVNALSRACIVGQRPPHSAAGRLSMAPRVCCDRLTAAGSQENFPISQH